PDQRGRLPERGWVLATDDRFVRIVVKIDQVFAPADPKRLTRGQDDAYRGLEAFRPAIRGADRRALPVEPTHEAGHFALSKKTPRKGLRRIPLSRRSPRPRPIRQIPHFLKN